MPAVRVCERSSESLGSSDTQEALEQIHDQIRSCRLCPLCRNRTKAVPGEGASHARIMFVGEGPGGEEDRQGRPFVGAAGRVLDQQLRRIGLSRRAVFITNIVKCRPPGNRDPKPEEIEACRDYLLSQIALIQPAVICTLGRFAAQTLLDTNVSITREHGKPRRVSGIVYVPIYHPAAALHQPQLASALEADFAQLRSLLKDDSAASRKRPGTRHA
ncbi:MAG: uracil-DNA glycosylase [Armatimonadetes bacterium]|nr:uracil-DNA glycosylase [Armatimonadota bacterium]